MKSHQLEVLDRERSRKCENAGEHNISSDEFGRKESKSSQALKPVLPEQSDCQDAGVISDTLLIAQDNEWEAIDAEEDMWEELEDSDVDLMEDDGYVFT